jgi:hypothetical protein
MACILRKQILAPLLFGYGFNLRVFDLTNGRPWAGPEYGELAGLL